MKYIVHNPFCKQYLKLWARNLPIVIARFYFWSAGDEDQKSQEGLLGSILHDALSQRPEEIPKVLAKCWSRSLLFGLDFRAWTFSELVEAVNNLVARANGNFKLCLFIDGLDEFEGDHEELIDLFRRAVSLPHVKACVSSRPWVVFEEAFIHRPSLMLEHLTYPEILACITDRFNENSGFTRLRSREPQFASSLVENIAKKSCGVFLWVTLVVKSLLSGLASFDRMKDLQRRLDDLPSDLERFYQKIFDSIDPFYALEAAQMFRLVAAANGKLTVLELSYADDDFNESFKQALEAEVGRLDEEEQDYRVLEVKRRLNSRCKGLLEIPLEEYGEQDDGESDVRSTDQNESEDHSNRMREGVGSRLDYENQRDTISAKSLAESDPEADEPKESENQSDYAVKGSCSKGVDECDTDRAPMILSLPSDSLVFECPRPDDTRYARPFNTADSGHLDSNFLHAVRHLRPRETVDNHPLLPPKTACDTRLPQTTLPQVDTVFPTDPSSTRDVARPSVYYTGHTRDSTYNHGSSIFSDDSDHPHDSNYSTQQGLPVLSWSRPASNVPRMNQHISERPQSGHNSHEKSISPIFVTPNMGQVPKSLRLVAYLHRTAKDFLESPPIEERIQEMAGTSNPYPTLLNSSILMIKKWDGFFQRYSSLHDQVRQCMQYAPEAEKSGSLHGNLLDELERCVKLLVPHSLENIDHDLRTGEYGLKAWSPPHAEIYPKNFLNLAARYPLWSYIYSKILRNAQIFPDEARTPLLDRIIIEHHLFQSFCEPDLLTVSCKAPNIAFIRRLLKSGTDPNFVIDGQTIWGNLLRECIFLANRAAKYPHSLKSAVINHWAAIVELFIRAGADPRMNRNSQIGSCIREAFGGFSVDKAKRLEKLLASTQKRCSLTKRFAMPPLKRKVPTRDESTPITISNSLSRVKISDGSLGDVFPSGKDSKGRRSNKNDSQGSENARIFKDHDHRDNNKRGPPII